MKIILALVLFGVIIGIISDGDGGGIVGVGFLIVLLFLLFLLFRWLFGWAQSVYPGDFDMAFFKALGKVLGKALVTIISLPFLLLAMLLKAL